MFLFKLLAGVSVACAAAGTAGTVIYYDNKTSNKEIEDKDKQEEPKFNTEKLKISEGKRFCSIIMPFVCKDEEKGK